MAYTGPVTVNQDVVVSVGEGDPWERKIGTSDYKPAKQAVERAKKKDRQTRIKKVVVVVDLRVSHPELGVSRVVSTFCQRTNTASCSTT
jgi:hypothetical protein